MSRRPGRAGASRVACDTSVLVPALVQWHEHHVRARDALGHGARASLPWVPGHVVIETYSVLTRLPTPHRLAPASAADLLSPLSERVLILSADRYLAMVVTLAAHGVQGGATYDGLVGATALEHGAELLTLDRRAVRTYDALGVSVRLL